MKRSTVVSVGIGITGAGTVAAIGILVMDLLIDPKAPWYYLVDGAVILVAARCAYLLLTAGKRWANADQSR